MPRSYFRKEGARPYNTNKGKDLEGALTAVNAGMSIRAAAKEFGISNTLQRRINGNKV